MRNLTLDLGLVRLDVDVPRTLPDGVGDDLVHELGHRRVLAGVLVDLRGGEAGGVLKITEHVIDVGLVRGEPLDRADQVALGGNDRADVAAGDDSQIVDREDVGGVRHRHDQLVVLDANRQHQVLAHEVLGDERSGVGVDVVRAHIDEGEAHLLGNGLRDPVLADVAQVLEHRRQ